MCSCFANSVHRSCTAPPRRSSRSRASAIRSRWRAKASCAAYIILKSTSPPISGGRGGCRSSLRSFETCPSGGVGCSGRGCSASGRRTPPRRAGTTLPDEQGAVESLRQRMRPRRRAAASRWFVRAVAIAEKTASPSAPPSCCDALSSAAARPALSGGTPSLAAVTVATKTAPMPNATMSRPGSRSPTNEPWTGMRDSR